MKIYLNCSMKKLRSPTPKVSKRCCFHLGAVHLLRKHFFLKNQARGGGRTPKQKLLTFSDIFFTPKKSRSLGHMECQIHFFRVILLSLHIWRFLYRSPLFSIFPFCKGGSLGPFTVLSNTCYPPRASWGSANIFLRGSGGGAPGKIFAVSGAKMKFLVQK